jgi:hypothetical protein
MYVDGNSWIERKRDNLVSILDSFRQFLGGVCSINTFLSTSFAATASGTKALFCKHTSIVWMSVFIPKGNLLSIAIFGERFAWHAIELFDLAVAVRVVFHTRGPHERSCCF